MVKSSDEKLLVLWTSGEREAATNMVFMYTLNGCLNAWWQEVTLLIWGASGKLLVENTALQKQLPKMIDAGVRIIACKKCAENQGIAERLEALGVEVFYTGTFLTDWLKSEKKILSV